MIKSNESRVVPTIELLIGSHLNVVNLTPLKHSTYVREKYSIWFIYKLRTYLIF